MRQESGPPDVRALSPSVTDPVVGVASEVVGGPVGRHAAGARTAVVVPAVAVMVAAGTAVLAVAVLLRQHCRATLWASPDQFTHACYSDLPALHASVAAGEELAQPVGTGALVRVAAALAPDGPSEVRWFFDVGVLMIAVALAVTVASVARLAGPRRWDAGLVALSPVLLTSSLISLDLVAVALTCAALLAWSRHRPFAAGVLLGLAVSVRPLALVVLLAAGLLAMRTGRGLPWLRLLAGTVAGCALLTVPALVLSVDGWAAYARQAWGADVGYGSVLLLPQLASSGLAGGVVPRDPPGWLALTGVGALAGAALALAVLPPAARRSLPARSLLRPDLPVVVAAVAVAVLPVLAVLLGAETLTALSDLRVSGRVASWLSVGLGGAVVVAVALFTLSVRRRPRLPVVVLLLLVGLLLAAPSLPVQAAVWVLPVAALAVPSWRLLLAWAGAEALYATGTWFYVYWLSVPERGLPPWAYAVLLLLRVAALVALAWRAVELSVHPEDDPVRNAGQAGDDPSAGPIEHAPDALVVGFR